MSKECSFPRKVGRDGSENPKYVDLLEEDRPVAGQKFVCVSFVSPENTIKQKEVFYFEQFLKHWDFTKSTQKFTKFLHFLAYKYNIDFDSLTADLSEFMKSEKKTVAETTIEDDYKNFVDAKSEDLEETFSNTHNFTTSVRGIKVRGSYPTQAEAELRCRMIREVDPHHNVFVGPVGLWMPWEPEAYKTGRVEYLEEELNELMHEKAKNEKKARVQFDKRVAESKRRAIEENVKIAKESGNKLTQTLNSAGELVGVKNTSTIESNLGDGRNVSVADIRQELFEGQHVRTKAGDKQLELEISEKTEEETGKEDSTDGGNGATTKTESDPSEEN